jgi:curved DNA-binding protein CbpA
VRLTKAYEVLKDAESRKKYDLYGEEGIGTSHKQSYHSWSYYRDNFGIYDDDPEIVTLNKADFGKYCHNWHDFSPFDYRCTFYMTSQFFFSHPNLSYRFSKPNNCKRLILVLSSFIGILMFCMLMLEKKWMKKDTLYRG